MTIKFEKAVPVLPAVDAAESAAFYIEKLGFREAFRDATPPKYIGVIRDELHLHLASAPPELARTIGDQTMCRFYVSDVDALYEEYSAHNIIHPNGPIHNTPWNTREFSVIDPTGVCLTFFGTTA